MLSWVIFVCNITIHSVLYSKVKKKEGKLISNAREWPIISFCWKENKNITAKHKVTDNTLNVLCENQAMILHDFALSHIKFWTINWWLGLICIINLNKIHENLAFEKSISGCCSMNLAKKSKYEITILFVIHKERGGLHHQLSKFTALVE